jgi:hypothetical protein
MTAATLLIVALGIAFVTGGAVALRDVRASRARRARALPATGVVVSVDADDHRSPSPVVRYRDARGVEHDATSAGTRPGPQEPSGWFVRGQQVLLHYDPERPSWVLVEGTSDPVGIDLAVGTAGVLAGALLLAGDVAVQLLG